LSDIYANTTTTDSDFIAQPDPSTINDPNRLLDHYDAELQNKSPRRKTVPEISAIGTILQEAKQRLPKGHFGLLVARQDMERSGAARFMAIAKCFSNVDNIYIGQLPASTITLYTMTRLKWEVLEGKLKSGEFNTRTTAKQVQALLPPPKPKKPPSRLNQLRRFVSKHREAIELKFADNPVLERTIPREILEIIEAAKQRRVN
jgi:hypothetical protein